MEYRNPVTRDGGCSTEALARMSSDAIQAGSKRSGEERGVSRSDYLIYLGAISRFKLVPYSIGASR